MTMTGTTPGEARFDACSACDAVVPKHATFCANCGAPLAAAPPNTEAEPSTKERGTKRSRRRSGDQLERSRARNEFGRIKHVVFTMRATFWASVALAAAQVGLFHIALGKVLFASTALKTALFVLLYGQLALTLAGALFVLRAPLLWTTIGACYWTLNTTVGIYANDFRVSPIDAVMLFMLVAFWAAVGQAARVQRLLRENPELQLVRKRIAPERVVSGGVAEAARERHRVELRRRRIARLRFLGATGLGVVLVGLAAWWWTRPPSAGEFLRTFRERWGTADVDAIAGMMRDGPHGREARELREQIERRGWGKEHLRIEGEELEEDGDRAATRLRCTAGAVVARFLREGDKWSVFDVELPPFEPPPIDDTIRAFRSAWGERGIEAMVAMTRESSRSQLQKSLHRLFDRRTWLERRPPLGEVDAGSGTGVRRSVLFSIGNREMTVVFEFWFPSWHLAGITLPV
jgi:hypothetical protein